MKLDICHRTAIEPSGPDCGDGAEYFGRVFDDLPDQPGAKMLHETASVATAQEARALCVAWDEESDRNLVHDDD